MNLREHLKTSKFISHANQTIYTLMQGVKALLHAIEPWETYNNKGSRAFSDRYRMYSQQQNK